MTKYLNWNKIYNLDITKLLSVGRGVTKFFICERILIEVKFSKKPVMVT